MQEVGETKKAAQAIYDEATEKHRALVMEKLGKLSAGQQAKFWMFEKARSGLAAEFIPSHDLDWASDVIERTIRQNEKDPSRLR